MYIAAAEDVSPEDKVADWWKIMTEIPAWTQACKLILYLFSRPLHLQSECSPSCKTPLLISSTPFLKITFLYLACYKGLLGVATAPNLVI